MCENDHIAGPDLSRRGLLRTTGLVGIGALTLGAASVTAGPDASAAGSDAGRTWAPNPDSSKFTFAVMPDTQYLFDGEAIHPEPLRASLRYLLKQQREQNIVFLAHLGDLTQNGQPAEIVAIGEVFGLLDRAGAAYSVLAGNHDVSSSTDDQRGSTPYLNTFGPARFRTSQSFLAATPDGYNTAHRFRAAGREWIVLALDWRTSATGIAMVKQVLAAHPTTPAILTTHDLVSADTLDGKAVLSDHGRTLWNDLIFEHDQIFLTLNGHYWPPGRTVLPNAAGHDVHLHITNYQNRYYGGAAMIRLYHFDLERGVIDVETMSPFLMAQPPERRNQLGAQEAELSGDLDRFTIEIDWAQRFAGFAPVPARRPRPAAAMLVPGTVAYWRFDGGTAGTTLAPETRVNDLSGRGNHLVVAGRPGRQADALTWSAEHHPDQPTHSSLVLRGGRASGDYLRTVDGAVLDTETFPRGYTFEAFFKLPADFNPGTDAWAALLSRAGTSAEAGKAKVPGNGDPQEPVVTLSLSGDREPQWCVYPQSQDGSLTNWGHELPLNGWWHVAVINDGRHTTMYIDGCPVVRNPTTRNRGLGTSGRDWLLGGYDYNGVLDQILKGWVGDVRVVDRALSPSQLMIVT